MKRRSALLGLACMGAAPVLAREDAPWVMAHQFDPGSLAGRAADRFAREVDALSQGAMRIRVLAGGALGDATDNLNLVRAGRLPLTLTGDLVLSLDPDYRVLNIPFIYRDAAHALATYASEIGQRLFGSLRRAGVESLAWHLIGNRFLTANRPIQRASELKGLVLRLPADPTWQLAWRTLGVDTVTLPFPELKPALRAGRIDAQENPPNFIRSGGFHEHQRYLIQTAHMPQRQVWLAASGWWNGLSSEQRGVLMKAAQAVARWTTDNAQHEEAGDVTWLQRAGDMQLLGFDRENIPERLRELPRMLSGDYGMRLADQIARIAA